MPQTIIQYNEELNEELIKMTEKYKKSKADIIVLILEGELLGEDK